MRIETIEFCFRSTIRVVKERKATVDIRRKQRDGEKQKLKYHSHDRMIRYKKIIIDYILSTDLKCCFDDIRSILPQRKVILSKRTHRYLDSIRINHQWYTQHAHKERVYGKLTQTHPQVCLKCYYFFTVLKLLVPVSHSQNIRTYKTSHEDS
jgi:hypothetical protein